MVSKKLREEAALLEKPETMPYKLNDAFKRWFGNSKAVDENGNPLICFHGSTVNIEEFNDAFSGNNTGNNLEKVFYFTTDKEIAITYSQEATVRSRETEYWDEHTEEMTWQEFCDQIREEIANDPKINPCFIKMENPYIYDADYTAFDHKKNYTILSMLKGNYDMDPEMIDSDMWEEMVELFTDYDEETEEYISKDIKYDGLIIKNVQDNIADRYDYINEYIVWDPTQIKSIYNKGFWDPTNANVYENMCESIKALTDKIVKYNVKEIEMDLEEFYKSLNKATNLE